MTDRSSVPLFEDGRTLDVANLIWCTGFQPGKLTFPLLLSSETIQGVGRDTEWIAGAVADRARMSGRRAGAQEAA